jgi:hypothetical protein
MRGGKRQQHERTMQGSTRWRESDGEISFREETGDIESKQTYWAGPRSLKSGVQMEHYRLSDGVD